MTFLKNIENYYTQKIQEHGASPQGVDWKDADGQILRFEQLCKILPTQSQFSLNDIGCGCGSLVDFLTTKFDHRFNYYGFDVSTLMIDTAKAHYVNNSNVHLFVGSEPSDLADFSVASGIFNVRLNISDNEWLAYIYQTLDMMYSKSKSGFAFNCLTSYSDEEKMKDYLYYANPSMLFDFCKKHYSKNIALLHDYELYEFTILVRK